MKHEIKTDDWGPYGEPMAKAVQSCVHCGFCLPTCPTYQELGQESDSPRGRILLMKDVLEGNLSAEQIRPHIDRCLGCVACVTACPSGVQYGELISPYRAATQARQKQTWVERLKRRLVFGSLPYPKRFRWAIRSGQWTRPLHGLVPSPLRPMLALLPNRLPKRVKLKPFYPAEGTTRARVALLAGCAQQVLRPTINLATIRVLNRRGIEVFVPRQQGCCGALAWHAGEGALAIRFAKANVRAFPEDLDAIITNAAGCGSGLHDYRTILRGTADEAAGQRISERAVDVSVFLNRFLDVSPDVALKTVRRVAMQDACHLAHAQGVRIEPRRLFEHIKGLELVDLPDATTCCGSAGTYNLDQPEIAFQLGQRKAKAVQSTGCSDVVTGNIGCLIQMEQHLAQVYQTEAAPKVWHTLEFLDALETDAVR